MIKKVQNKIRFTTLIYFSLLFVMSFLISASKELDPKKIYKALHNAPPGTIKISSNLFYDKMEMTNLSYCEYFYWTSRIMGEDSEELLALLPDQKVWGKDFTCFERYCDYYFMHPDFKYHPVVGITQEQAINFAKWRSDRVFEFYLIIFKLIKVEPNQNRDNYFTIEKYYSGNYMNYKTNKNFKYYPSYRLPTLKEYKMALNYEDSSRNGLSNKIQCNIKPCLNDSLVIMPTTNVDYNTQTNKKNRTIFFNLKGNVNEWIDEPNICVGGSWADSMEKIEEQDTFYFSSQNCYTGFRCVCEIKEWKFE